MSAGARAPPRVAWTGRAFLLVAAGASLGLLAVALRSPLPLFLGVPLLLAPISSGLFLPREGLRARLEWSETGTGRAVRVTGRLLLDPPVSASQLYPRFDWPEPLRPVAPPTLAPVGAELRFAAQMDVPFPCVVELGLPDLLWRDPLGLVELPVAVEGSTLPVERYPPELHRLGTVNLRRTTTLPGEIRSNAIGGTGEFHAIRRAAPTDTVRRINWRATARAGELIANDYRLERTGDLVILVDARPTSSGPARDALLLALSRAAAVGVAAGFLDAKSRVGVGVFGEFLDAVPLGSGRRQRFRIRSLLRESKLTESPGPAERLAISMRQYFPPGVLTLLLSPMAEEEQLLLLPHLRRRGYPVIVVSPSPVPLLIPPEATRREDRLARRLMNLDRRRRIAEVWKEAPTVDWTDYWALGQLVALLRHPSRRGGAS
ncbi:MAG: DUF58 domain-containing protein [Thermoplasmata archaeon]|nr:DUF58 domain-containing protein [Thermoplasmata archaeon]